MTFNLPPIIERELRLASRRSGNYWGRTAGAALAIVFGLGFFLGGHVVGRSPVAGQTAFAVVGLVGGLLVAVSVLQLSAEAFVKEKREDTLGLLFLTPLKPIELVLGKLLSTSLPAFYRFVAVIPILGLPMLMGGVSAQDFLLLVVGLLGIVVFGAAIGLFCSALSWDEKAAVSSATSVLIAVVAVPWVLYGVASFLGKPWAHWLFMPTPVYPVWHALMHRPIPAMGLLIWVAWTCLATAFLIRLTCRVLPRCWIQRPVTAVPRLAVQEHGPVLTPIRSQGQPGSGWGRFNFSNKFTPEQRAELLDKNPILWLSLCSQMKLPRVRILGIVCVVAVVIVFVASQNAMVLVEPGLALIGCYLINASLKVSVGSLAANALVREHPHESLELLLSTPLGPRELVEGHVLAIRQAFRPLVIRALWLEVTWLAITISIKGMTEGWVALGYLLSAVVMVAFLIPDLHAVGWSSLWQGVTARNAREAEQEGLRVLAMPWIGIFIFSMVVMPFVRIVPEEMKTVLMWMLFGFLANRWFTKRARMHLANHLEIWARRRAVGELEHYTFWARVGRWFGTRMRAKR